MARKSIELAHLGLRSPRERIWHAVRQQQGADFTVRDLQKQITPAVHVTTVRSYLSELVAAGYLTTAKNFAELKRNEGHVYSLLKDSFEAPRVTASGVPVTQGIATLAMWRSMRALGQFDHHDIARSASLGHVQVPPSTAKAYVLALHKAGYFRVVKKGGPGTATRYQLVRYTGALPPAITRRKCIFDRNLGEFTWQQSEQEVCDGIA